MGSAGFVVTGALLVLTLSAACDATPKPNSTPPPIPTSAPGSSDKAGEIRRTDWPNATVRNLDFCGESDDAVVFRDGSNDFDIPCVMLPGGAKPVYAHFINEEPANRPGTEDALVLVELGNPYAARWQALVPIQLSEDGKTLLARPPILGDDPSPAGDRVMTFTSYRIEADLTVVATVRRLDGGTETRRYRRTDGNGSWARV